MDKSKIYPRTGDTQTVYLKSVISRPTIEVGDFTVYNDFVNEPFSPDVIEKLRKLQWWDWPKDRIREAIHAIQSGDIEMMEL